MVLPGKRLVSLDLVFVTHIDECRGFECIFCARAWRLYSIWPSTARVWLTSPDRRTHTHPESILSQRVIRFAAASQW